MEIHNKINSKTGDIILALTEALIVAFINFILWSILYFEFHRYISPLSEGEGTLLDGVAPIELIFITTIIVLIGDYIILRSSASLIKKMALLLLTVLGSGVCSLVVIHALSLQ
jgi:hypothetical protein